MPVVRISKGKFDLENLAEAEQLLAASQAALHGALTQLTGLLHYYVGIDRRRAGSAGPGTRSPRRP